MKTVCFDTNFYVSLARASDEEASECIARLNALDVRLVVTDNLVRELCVNAHNPQQDRALYARLSLLQRPPLQLGDLPLEALNASDEERHEIANMLQGVHAKMTIAGSVSTVAASDQLKTLEETQAIVQANGAELKQAGFPVEALLEADDEQAAAHPTFDFLEQLLEDEELKWLEQIPEVAQLMTIVRGLATGQRPSPGTVEPLIQEMKRQLHALHPAVMESQTIRGDVFAGDTRPAEIALGLATDSIMHKVGSSQRDAEHMGTFAAHRDMIDYQQVDRRQLNAMQNTSARPLRLEELKLVQRCFAPPKGQSSSAEVLDALEACMALYPVDRA